MTQEFKPMQLLRLEDRGSSVYAIHSVTEKAIMIECDNGRWMSNTGFKPLWIPKSIINYIRFNDSRQNSDHGIHCVTLPEWFCNKNKSLL